MHAQGGVHALLSCSNSMNYKLFKFFMTLGLAVTKVNLMDGYRVCLKRWGGGGESKVMGGDLNRRQGWI